MTNSYFNISGTSEGRKTLAQLKNEETYSFWDFETVWGIDEDKNNGMPYLLNQPKLEDFTGGGQEDNSLQLATEAVETAESSKTQEDINTARDLVSNLQDGQDKSDLLNRLDVLQNEIDGSGDLQQAQLAVQNAEQSEKTRGL